VKSESRMDRNRLGGELGDKSNAILAACRFNLRKLLRGFAHWARFWRFLWRVWRRLRPLLAPPGRALAATEGSPGPFGSNALALRSVAWHYLTRLFHSVPAERTLA
jgi:hypothetical protein